MRYPNTEYVVLEIVVLLNIFVDSWGPVYFN